jgi:hypothetical protein
MRVLLGDEVCVRAFCTASQIIDRLAVRTSRFGIMIRLPYSGTSPLPRPAVFKPDDRKKEPEGMDLLPLFNAIQRSGSRQSIRVVQ